MPETSAQEDLVKHRSVAAVIILSLVTCGIYTLFWMYFTKEEMNAQGAKIPTFLLAFIPIVNIYWMWKYCEGVGYVTGESLSGPVAFLLLFLLGIIGVAIVQNSLNAAPVRSQLPSARVVS